MKNIFKKAAFIAISTVLLAVPACSDFEEINKDPHAVDGLATKPWFALNKSIIKSQQNPDVAERLFVINWAAGARQDGEDGYGISLAGYNDDHIAAGYNQMCDAIKYCQDAITLCDLHTQEGKPGEHEAAFLPNVKAFSRIWRVYLMSEFSDSFGPLPVDGFKGINPAFNSVKDVYQHFYQELSAAITDIKTDVQPTEAEAKCDPAYGYDAAKWKKFGISLWMRFAMRLSEADPATAKAEFEKAVKAGSGITTEEETFRVQEKSGWDDLSGVMSRVWDIQTVSATMANLTTNLGGTDILDVLKNKDNGIWKNYTADTIAKYYGAAVKDADTYLGKRFENHWLMNTDNPTKGLFFDGLPKHLDPRMLAYFTLPGDYSNRTATGYFPYATHKKARAKESMYDTEKPGEQAVLAGTETDAKFCWNGLTAGIGEDETCGKFNGLVNGEKGVSWGYVGTYPCLSEEYRNNTNKRVFFGPWETWFLLAEAAVRGWDAGVKAEDAYNKGIKASFDYNKMGPHYESYINSEGYNRVGTSVKFSHTAEPVNVEMDYTDGYTGTAKKMVYAYPDANKILYKGKKLNDALTKIITQKYIANTPWLPLENWSDHRRLGLPFWEIVASTTSIDTMKEWKQDSYKEAQKPGLFFQRMRYPSSLKNADPEGYAKAIELLGGEDIGTTPLWWAIGGH